LRIIINSQFPKEKMNSKRILGLAIAASCALASSAALAAATHSGSGLEANTVAVGVDGVKPPM
jgi:hypothetical protein